MDKLSKSILKSVLSLPTMSFHEEAVATFVKWYARGLGLDVAEDRFGNILVQSHRGKGAGVTFAAHTDHPGFEVISSRGKTATVAMWGRIEPKIFTGARIVVHSADGTVRGKIGRKKLSRTFLRRPCFPLKTKGRVLKGDFGHFDLPAIKFGPDRIITRAADDLVSAALILDLMTRINSSKSKVKVSGLFTRAEESGFIGAFAAIESGIIPKGDPIVVMECSKAEKGKVAMGAGPVVRPGDKLCTFDPNVDIWIASVARVLKEESKGFRYQREIMQGGRCEAALYLDAGFVTGALALPLGNYHNLGPSGPAAEYVSASDYENMLRLMTGLAKSGMPEDPLKMEIAPIKKRYRERRGKLLASR